jgi:hypothetical protein
MEISGGSHEVLSEAGTRVEPVIRDGLLPMVCR